MAVPFLGTTYHQTSAITFAIALMLSMEISHVAGAGLLTYSPTKILSLIHPKCWRRSTARQRLMSWNIALGSESSQSFSTKRYSRWTEHVSNILDLDNFGVGTSRSSFCTPTNTVCTYLGRHRATSATFPSLRNIYE